MYSESAVWVNSAVLQILLQSRGNHMHLKFEVALQTWMQVQIYVVINVCAVEQNCWLGSLLNNVPTVTGLYLKNDALKLEF